MPTPEDSKLRGVPAALHHVPVADNRLPEGVDAERCLVTGDLLEHSRHQGQRALAVGDTVK